MAPQLKREPLEPESERAVLELRVKERAAKKLRAKALKALEIKKIEIKAADQMEMEPIDWLWLDHIAKGKFHLIAGGASTGKTTIACHIAACISAGKPFPFGNRPEPGKVLIWSCEDSATDTLLPRLHAAGANLRNIKFIGDVRTETGRRSFDPAMDVEDLLKRIKHVRGVSMIIIDPIVMAISGDSHKNAEVRRGLDPLVRLAEKRGIALIGLTHFSKGTEGRDPTERVTGSLAFSALARVVLATAMIPAADGQEATRLLVRVKANNSVTGGGFHYSIEEKTVGSKNIRTTCIKWTQQVEGTPSQLMRSPSETESPRNEARSFLYDLLAQGPTRVTDLYHQARAAGFSQAQMQRAAKPSLVLKRKIGFGTDAYWLWSLRTHTHSAIVKGSEDSEEKSPRSSLSLAEDHGEPDF
jgi:RecA-family ATPase